MERKKTCGNCSHHKDGSCRMEIPEWVEEAVGDSESIMRKRNSETDAHNCESYYPLGGFSRERCPTELTWEEKNASDYRLDKKKIEELQESVKRLTKEFHERLQE